MFRKWFNKSASISDLYKIQCKKNEFVAHRLSDGYLVAVNNKEYRVKFSEGFFQNCICKRSATERSSEIVNKLPLLILLLGGVLLLVAVKAIRKRNKSSKVSTEETTVIETVAREQSKESFTSEATKNRQKQRN